MKELVCEMCGSNNLIKQDGLFVCQMCGTKYSVEEAKKMMIEGTVDVSGSTVKVDNSASIENFYKMADNAYVSGNNKEAEDYCNRIIEIEPENYKAWLLKGKAAGWQSTLGHIRIEESVNCFTRAVENTPEDEKDRVKREASQEIENLSIALIKTCCGNFAKNASESNMTSILENLKLSQLYSLVLLSKCGISAEGFKKNIALYINNAAMDAWNNKVFPDYKYFEHPTKLTWETFIQQGDCCLKLLETAVPLYEKNDKDNIIISYKNMIAITTKLMYSCSLTYINGGWHREYELTQQARTIRIDLIMGWHAAIKELDPNYEIPKRPSSKTGGCYVATAVYGSYDCPQVWTLRRYRDYDLAQKWYGRVFIHTYYTISPTLVKLFGHTNWFKKMCKGKLDRMVKNLQDKGYESTPYEDQNW